MILSVFFILLRIFICESAKIKLPKFFTDNMVLQQFPTRAQIWGSVTKPGEEKDGVIKVHLHDCQQGRSQIHTALLNERSEFSATLRPMPAKARCSLTISLNDNISNSSINNSSINNINNSTVTLTNVLFGDVWFCSGQSNMQFPVGDSEEAEETTDESHLYPNIRMFKTAVMAAKIPRHLIVHCLIFEKVGHEL